MGQKGDAPLAPLLPVTMPAHMNNITNITNEEFTQLCAQVRTQLVAADANLIVLKNSAAFLPSDPNHPAHGELAQLINNAQVKFRDLALHSCKLASEVNLRAQRRSPRVIARARAPQV